jgi:hypothetical protein
MAINIKKPDFYLPGELPAKVSDLPFFLICNLPAQLSYQDNVLSVEEKNYD